MNLLGKLVLSVFWAAGVYGSLHVHQLDLGLGHGVCGPWGCGPRVEALLGFHGFWLLLLIPAALVVAWVMPRHWLGGFGIALTFVGLAATVGYMIWDGVTYVQAAQSSVASYWCQRALFAVVTLVDVPLVPTTLAGLVLWRTSRKPSHSETLAELTSQGFPAA